MNNKIPIFILSGKSPIGASGGGYSTYAYNLARVVRKLGHPIYIVALGDETKTEKTEVGTLLTYKATLPIINVKIYALPGLPLYSFIFAKGIKKVMDEEKYKKVVIWGIGPWGLAASILKTILGHKVIHLNNYFTTSKHEWIGGLRALRVSDYGIIPKLKYLAVYLTAVQYISLLERLVLKTANYIITNYKSTEEILKKEFGIKSKRFYWSRFYVQVYKRSVANAKFGEEIKTPNKYILYFSRQDPRKGVNFLLHSMKILINKGYKVPLLIAGGGDMLPYNKKLAIKLGIAKWVKFLGFVNNPKPLMKKCSVFTFSSIEEGAGALTINEAMEMGLPIVSTACDGIVEDIKDGKTGLLVPMEDSETMAKAIAKLLDNPKLARTLGNNARKSYDKNFNFNNMYKDIKKLLASL
jgi:glycosyltransferase involved in cell wall biosynthesis